MGHLGNKTWRSLGRQDFAQIEPSQISLTFSNTVRDIVSGAEAEGIVFYNKLVRYYQDYVILS